MAAVKALARKSPSRRPNDPEYCLEGMSREECEEVFRAQQRVAQRGGSVNAEQCVENPTPECEEALRPILEAQYAASQGSGD